MGSGCSKRKGTDAAGPVQLKINAPERMPQVSADDSKVADDLSSYEAACRDDPDLKTFDRLIQDRTSRALNSLATGAEVQTLSFDSLKEVSGFVFAMNLDVVEVILASKEDIWKSKELSTLVKEYLENSIKTLEFCGGLENCLKRARTNQLIIQLAVQKFEEEVKVQGEGEGDERKFGKTLDELNKFKAAEKPFDEEFFRQFRSVYDQQLSLFKKLQQQKRKVDKKLKKAKTWRKLSNMLFVTVLVSVVVFSVVAAAIAAPPVVTAVAGALIVPVGGVGKWCSSLWTRYENKLKGQQELIGSMEFGTYYFTIKDMETIGVLVGRMETKIESLLYGADFAVREQEAVKLVIDEMKKKLEEFMETIEDLGKQADKCSREIRKARTVILQKIIGPSSQSSTLDSLWNRLNL
ncbi:hypothetical protein SLEP1_g11989 [Rubroshorea leprosula]|nr:hypothetical protein SLEP1_g11989 [Rubroshorea leprosula]